MTLDSKLAQALEALSVGRRRVAVIYEAGLGWCVTDDMDVLDPKMGPNAPEYRVIAYRDWFRGSLEQAVDVLCQIRVLRAQANLSNVAAPRDE